jgi:glycerol-3-phosphate O-acyltransferase
LEKKEIPEKLLELFIQAGKIPPVRWFAGMVSNNRVIRTKDEVVSAVAREVVRGYSEKRLDAAVAARTAKAYQLVHFRAQIKSLKQKILDAPLDGHPERLHRQRRLLKHFQRKIGELSALKTPLEIIEYLSNYYADDMAAEFDPAFFLLFKQLSYRFFPNLAKSLRISEARPGLAEEIKSLSEKAPVIFLPNHLSNADHIPICLALSAFGLPQPKIAAGDNLFRGVSALALPRLNAYRIRREYIGEGGFFREIKWFQNPVYRKVHTEYLKYGWNHNEPLMFYPEGTRSRDGKIGKPKLGIMADIFAYTRENGRSVYLVPVSLAYTIVPEDKEIEASRTGKNISHKDLLSQLANLDKQYKAYSRSEIDVRFGVPVELTSEKQSRGKLAEELMAMVADGVVITPTYRLAAAICKFRDGGGSGLFAVSAIRAIFAEIGGESEKLVKDEDIDGALNDALGIFAMRGFLALHGENCEILDEPLLRQYANRISSKLK